LEVEEDVVLGRGQDETNFVDLGPHDAEMQGVSRRHALLRSTLTHLLVLDLGSSNGTRLNGLPLGSHTPYSLVDGDTLMLGSLEIVIYVLKRPKGRTDALTTQASLAEALVEMAKAITSQQDLYAILDEALEMAMALTRAGETAVWLVNESTGHLTLSARRNLDGDTGPRRGELLPAADTLAGKVLATGESVRASRTESGEPIKLRTDYVVDALLYVPLKEGKNTIGVLSAAHRQTDTAFTQQEESLLIALGELTAIAVQNARALQAERRRAAELEALHNASHSVISSLDLPTVLETVARKTHEVLGEVKSVQLYLYQDGHLQLGATTGSEERWGAPGSEADPDGVAYAVVKSREPIVVRDVRSGSPGGDATPIWKGSLVGLPLSVNEEPVGVMQIEHARSSLTLSDDEVRLVELLNAQAAIAIENARLFDRARVEIAEREQSRQALQTAYEELQAADRLKAEMIQNVAHEFRTPLFELVGYTGLLLDDPQDGASLTDQQRQHLAAMADAGEKLTLLVENFVAMKSHQEVAAERTPIDVGDLLKLAMEGIRVAAQERELSLALELADGLPHVLASPTAVGQMMDNLLSNAAKFTPPGGRITVRACPEDSHEHVCVSVSDTGIGIPFEEHERIFKRFYQVDGSSTRQHGGVGLGLALCKGIVEAHGGHIWVESGPGQGATFTFTLPAAYLDT
jgi:signal transduction histidine kinase/pSer/pThr/pTyr-binding forkhead associated (FHA) protein